MIGADNTDSLRVNKGTGWVSLGGYIKEICATIENTIPAIDTNDDVFVGHRTPGLGWTDAGLKTRQISAAAAGNPEVYAVGINNAVQVPSHRLDVSRQQAGRLQGPGRSPPTNHL